MEFAAEGKVPENVLNGFKKYTSDASDELTIAAKLLVFVNPTTRAGLIEQARYLEKQFEEDDCWTMPEDINGKPWPQVFLKELALSLSSRRAKPLTAGWATRCPNRRPFKWAC